MNIQKIINFIYKSKYILNIKLKNREQIKKNKERIRNEKDVNV